MKYKGKQVDILGIKEIFGQRVAWIKILESNEFLQVSAEDLEEFEEPYSLSHIRFVSLAAKIKDEISKKALLAPYESSLIPLPHQILVLEKVMQSDQNRFLLADEVGMGKTIEAGLILKELKLRGDVKRILVIVPKSAIMQWQSELKEHFNEIFHIYDSELINSLSRTFSNINVDQEFNFWEQHNQIIVSTDALKPISYRQGWPREKVEEYNKYRMEAVLKANFDLVIIDEVHKMGGANPSVSRYLLAQALCDAVPNAILLSATPHRGKPDHFRRILQLLDPDAFDGEGLPEIKEIEPYVIRTEKRLAVDYEGNKLFNERETVRFDVHVDPIIHILQRELYEDVTNYVRKGFNTAKKTKNSAKGLIMILFQRLVSSSTAAILSAMEGRLHRLQISEGDTLENYELDMDKIMEEEDSGFDSDSVYNSMSHLFLNDEEAYLKELILKAKSCIQKERDAKADALIEKYRKLQQEYDEADLKVLVFTEFRTTQLMLKRILESEGMRVTIINGSQEIEERKNNLSKFKKECQILIATDAAGESLNMQFCHIVFNYDLPWNPMMIEQRIGRVDRIGQKMQVKAFNMLTNNSVDRRVYEVIQEKLSNIISQLGINKTSDVLDSTLEQDKINNLYLQSLLDPSKFEFAGEKWLNEIKGKLKEYQATESILPEEEEIDPKKAAEVRYSPLPYYLENLLLEFTRTNNGSMEYMTGNYVQVNLNKSTYSLSFDSEMSLSNPGVEHLTLQHDLIKKILAGIGEFDTSKRIPVLSTNSDDDTSGVWSIWQINAKNPLEKKETYQAYFVSEGGKVFNAYANNLWNRLLSSPTDFKLLGSEEPNFDYLQKILPFQESAYRQLENSIKQSLDVKYEKKKRSYNYQKSRVSKIGIENIKISKLNKLKEAFEDWESEFKSSSKVIPEIKHLLSVKINA